jgi:hypothetical protein
MLDVAQCLLWCSRRLDARLTTHQTAGQSEMKKKRRASGWLGFQKQRNERWKRRRCGVSQGFSGDRQIELAVLILNPMRQQSPPHHFGSQ